MKNPVQPRYAAGQSLSGEPNLTSSKLCNLSRFQSSAITHFSAPSVYLHYEMVCFTGACIDNTLLSAQGVASYAKLSSVAVVQGELVSGLSALASQTGTLLQRHPTHLTALLQQYAAQQAQAEKAT